MTFFKTIKYVWFRSLLVSIVISMLMPLFTFSIGVSTESTEVPSLENVDPELMSKMTAEEQEAYLIKNVKMKKLSGFDKYIYPFTHPQIWYFYTKAVFSIFIFVFIATMISSTLCVQYFIKRLFNRICGLILVLASCQAHDIRLFQCIETF